MSYPRVLAQPRVSLGMRAAGQVLPGASICDNARSMVSIHRRWKAGSANTTDGGGGRGGADPDPRPYTSLKQPRSGSPPGVNSPTSWRWRRSAWAWLGLAATAGGGPRSGATAGSGMWARSCTPTSLQAMVGEMLPEAKAGNVTHA